MCTDCELWGRPRLCEASPVSCARPARPLFLCLSSLSRDRVCALDNARGRDCRSDDRGVERVLEGTVEKKQHQKDFLNKLNKQKNIKKLIIIKYYLKEILLI